MKTDLPALLTLAPSTQRSLAVTAGAIAACLLIIFLGVRPKQKHMRQNSLDLDTFNQTLALMRADIAVTEALKEKAGAVRAQLDALAAAGVIEPLLGSFAMRGKSLLDPVAQETGFRIDSVKELPMIPLRMPKPAPEQTYGRQPIEITGQGSYEQIAAFIAQTETAQSLATLSSLLILCQQQTPEVHKAIITFEWPAKGEKIKPLAAPTPKSKPKK